MQNQQQMAAMANMNAGGPVTGTSIMGNGNGNGNGNGPRRTPMEPRDQLNTYIYDYMLRNNQPQIAQMMIKCDMKMKLSPTHKASPSGRNINGVDGMDQDSKDDLPAPELPQGQLSDNSFLLDWWVQFWDIYSSSRSPKGSQYTNHVRNLTHMTNEQRNQRMMMANGGMNGMNQNQYNMMRLQQQNGNPSDLKRAMHQRNPNQVAALANMTQMQKQQMMGAQMQRDGSQMDGRQSPGSNDNEPSPNKRARLDGGTNQGNGPNQFNEFGQNVQQKSIEVYAHSLAQQQRMALNNHAISQGMNAGHQGSPMPQAASLDGSDQMFALNPPRNGMNNGQPGPPQGNHALQDYQMQLMLLEQQNKKRLLMARQEQDNITGPHAQGVGGPGGFPAAMSPQGSRPGPSPNPADMKKGTPRMGPQGLPGAGGSPMPEGMMQPQRNSPAPSMQFDPNAPPQGFPQQYPGLPGQMPTTPMMRPNPSSHPQFNGQPMNPQQMEAMRQNGMQNGAWRGPPGQPGMMPGQQQMGPMGGQPQQRGQMPPPPAPAGEQPRAQVPSPSQPAQAPPTPSQTSKANPKKKNTKDNKKPANKKGANTGATPAASGAEEPPTPTTPMHNKFQPNGQQQPPQTAVQQQPPAAQQQQQQQPGPMDNGNPPFGNINGDTDFELNLGFGDETGGLDQFDFESFLHVGDDSNTFGGLDFGTGFDAVEADMN